MLVGGIVGLVGVGVIGAALAFPVVTGPQTVPGLAAPTREISLDPTGVSTTTPPPPSPAPTSSAASVTPSPESAGLPQSVPVRVRIPSIGVDAGTVALGLVGNELETPADPDVVGWFVGAQTPGARGRAVLAGHLTWNGRNTVFARLPEVTAGAVVEVDREDGTTARFRISRVETFKKDDFPTAEVYAATDEPSLVLITCGGDYSQSGHYYDSNVIAFASALQQ